jgi:small neutral amino acid transporter SnatA (MarC family)
MKWIEENLSLVYEWLLTFSNKPSFFASKKIERFVILASMLVLTDLFLLKAIWTCSITSTDLMIVVGGWLTYAGFGMIQNRKDKQQQSVENKEIE